ncbi:MAG: hypothetical protein M4D85_06805 [Actinomycetota bacterium]|nr:hypothetical protein [Actinomycetota bacterium]
MSVAKPVEFNRWTQHRHEGAVPPVEETVRFHRDVIGLAEADNPFESGPLSVGFAFGANRLWIDRVVGIGQA